jgi:hypothetical protein
MAADSASATAAIAALRASWKATAPTRQDFGAVVSELQSLEKVGEGSIFERGAHVPVTHMAFFKPPATSFLSELKSRDRRSATEWEHVNTAGVWLELGQAALAIVKDGEASMTTAQMARLLALGDKAFGAAREVLAMRRQYFTDVVQYGVEAARQMAFIGEQSHDAVAVTSVCAQSLNQTMESEAAEMLEKTHPSRATGTGGSGNTEIGSSAGGAAADA